MGKLNVSKFHILFKILETEIEGRDQAVVAHLVKLSGHHAQRTHKDLGLSPHTLPAGVMLHEIGCRCLCLPLSSPPHPSQLLSYATGK